MIVKYLGYSVLVLILLVSCTYKERVNKRQCRAKFEAENEFIQGIIIEKYRDQANHSYETIIINNSKNEQLKSWIFVSDRGNNFQKVSLGDYIFKDKGSLTFNVLRDTLEFTFSLKFECKK